MRVEMFQDVQARDALVVVAFSSAGQAAPIAAHYLARNLDLPLVGHVRIPELDHLMAVKKGRATGIVRIFGGEVSCKLEHDCPTILLVTTEVPLPDQVGADIADAVLEWARHEEVQMVLALEGVPRDKADTSPDVYCASADPGVLDVLRAANIEPAGQAIVAGFSAHLALSAQDHQVKAGVILVQAHREHPDGRAAAALVKALDQLLPDVPVDSGPLLKEAMELEEELRRAQPAAPVVPRSPHTFI